MKRGRKSTIEVQSGAGRIDNPGFESHESGGISLTLTLMIPP
jgi:hypothetical protein